MEQKSGELKPKVLVIKYYNQDYKMKVYDYTREEEILETLRQVFHLTKTIDKIWLEDEQSLEAKLKVMQEYDLAGAAAWKLGFEKSGIWELISRYVNG